jgi:hypothetical protein
VSEDVPAAPPAEGGPVLLERRFEDEPLRLRDDGSGRVTGQPMDDARYGDLLLDAVVWLEEGDDHDGYGLFVRQSSPDRYAAFIVSPAGAASLLILDGEPLRLAEGNLPDEIPFHRGLGARNRISLLACGPCIVPLVNGVPLTGAMLDGRYTGGGAGALLVPGGPGRERTAAVDWVQARAVLAT